MSTTIEMAQAVADWLNNLNPKYQARPVQVTFEHHHYNKTYYGAEYTDKNGSQTLYLVGNITKDDQYKHRYEKNCFRRDDDKRDWFVAGYLGKGSYIELKEWQHDEYHPFGPNFIVMPWNPDEAIDLYASKPYGRLPMVVSYL